MKKNLMYRAGHCELTPVGPKKKNTELILRVADNIFLLLQFFLFLFQSHRKFPWMQKIHYGPKRKEVVDEKKAKLKTEKLKCSTFFIFQNESYNHFTKTHFCDILISRMAIQSVQIFGEWSSPRISHSPVLNSSFHFSKPHTSEQSLRIELKH